MYSNYSGSKYDQKKENTTYLFVLYAVSSTSVVVQESIIGDI